MCIIHDQKMACGCWRKATAEITYCGTARRSADVTTMLITPCSLEQCKPAIRPSIWYCIHHAPCKRFTGRNSDGNYEALKKNMSKKAVAHVIGTGRK